MSALFFETAMQRKSPPQVVHVHGTNLAAGATFDAAIRPPLRDTVNIRLADVQIEGLQLPPPYFWITLQLPVNAAFARSYDVAPPTGEVVVAKVVPSTASHFVYEPLVDVTFSRSLQRTDVLPVRLRAPDMQLIVGATTVSCSFVATST